MNETNLENLEVPQPETVTVLGDTPRNAPGNEPEKTVTMSQASLDALIKARQSAALKKAATAEAEVTRLKAIAVGNSEDASTVEKLRAEIALEQQRASAAEARAAAQEKAVLQSRLGASIDAVDAESVSKLLADRLVMRDGKAIVVDDAGAEQTNPDGTPTTPEQLYQSWAASHPWAVRGRVIAGTGQSGSTGSTPPAQKPLSFYFGPQSNSAAVNRLSIERPEEYRRLRRDAVRAGLIGGN